MRPTWDIINNNALYYWNCCVDTKHSYYRIVGTRQCICISFISHPAMYIQYKLSIVWFLFASLSSLSHWCTYKKEGPSRLRWGQTAGQWGDSCSYLLGDQKLVWTGLLAGCGVLWLYHQLDSSRDCPWGLWGFSACTLCHPGWHQMALQVTWTCGDEMAFLCTSAASLPGNPGLDEKYLPRMCSIFFLGYPPYVTFTSLH